jgi:hypothetical protein
MEIKKAIERLEWRFTEAMKNNRILKINQLDLDMYNSIAEYISETQKQQLQHNEPFAKLFILVYAKMVEHYKTDVFDDAPRKAIYSLLNQPIENIIEDFRERLNDVGIYNVLNELKVDLKPSYVATDEDIKSNVGRLSLGLDEKPDLLDEIWDFETTKECLEKEVNNALNLFKK